MPVIDGPTNAKLPTGGSSDGNKMAALKADIYPDEICTISPANLNRIESIYIDNTRGCATLFIRFDDTQREITIPPGCEICTYSFSSGSSFTLRQDNTDFPIRARLRMFACHQPCFERYPGSGLLEVAWDVINPPGEKILGVPYQQVYPRGIGRGGWDHALVTPGIVISDSPQGRDGDTVDFTSISWPGRMRHKRLRSTGKWYFELQVITPDLFYGGMGFSNVNQFNGDANNALATNDVFMSYDAYVRVGQVQAPPRFGGIMGQSGPVGFALDLDKRLLFARNAAGYSGDPIAGTGGIELTNLIYPVAPACSTNSSAIRVIGAFGNGHPFQYGPPLNYLPWNG